MSKATKSEEQILKRVASDNNLRLSLSAIRQAVESIWSSDAPRLIQDYTDHGIAHSTRVSDCAAKLLEANMGQPLSEQQSYLLLASVYLHDIGMQCDVVRFPQIKARAEKLGATYNIDFVAPTTSEYSLEEQKAIRKNHQYLSAAWIDHAYRSGESVLGSAARTIPNELVNDLMDVCMYHTKLSITDCPLMLRYFPTQKKQLLAAILRFADELDIDSRRVNVETVKTFRLDPSNSVYWWLHNCTKVDFIAKNVIRLSIQLHPGDANQYGSLVHSAFITEFQRKNMPTLEVLRQNEFPIAISADSEVIENEYATQLPESIIQALHDIQRDPNLHLIKVPANQEGGIDTGVYLRVGDRVTIAATGAISYDSAPHYTNPAGLFSGPKGEPLLFVQNQAAAPAVWPHPEAYRTDGGELGRIGSLFGWVGEYSEESSFLVGEGVELDVQKEGPLYLSVNDQKGAYDDNKGEFDVEIRITSKSSQK